jgi:ferredoxin-NADP reductase
MTRADHSQAAVAWDPRDEAHLTVVAKETVADRIVRLTLTSPDQEQTGRFRHGGVLPPWGPGAHIDLVLGNGLIRQYSLCGSLEDADTFAVAILREEDGRGGSAWVHDELDVGSELGVRGPRNNFGLVPATDYLFIAGGIGITPLLPMIREVDAAGADWRLLYGGRTRESMAFVEELLEIDPTRVDVRPEADHGLLDLAGALDQAPDGCAVYCCGPEPLLLAVEAQCASRPHLTLHVERFSPREQASDGAHGAFEVRLERSGRRVEVGPNESLLEALESAGVEMDFSCREGTCGTCETRVLAGVPDHRDSLLTDEEKAANDVMFPCVSRCLSGSLVLDL